MSNGEPGFVAADEICVLRDVQIAQEIRSLAALGVFPKGILVYGLVYYQNAKTSAQSAQDEYLTSRAILENLVGLEALKQIEN